MRDGVEGPAEQLESRGVAKVGGPEIAWPDVLDVLRRPEQLEELDRTGAPARHVEGQQFENRDRPLGAPVAQGVRDEGTLAGGSRRDRVQVSHPQQIAHV